jgi:hypothetical protein
MRLYGCYLLTCLVTACKGENEYEHRLNYGILFQRQIDIQFSSEYWIHKWKVDIPSESNFTDTTYFNGDFPLSHLNPIFFQLDTIRQQTQRHLSQTRQLVYDMIPETTGNKGFSKRALLPFVGDLSKSIFGIATENDVRVLAGHINALTRQQNKVVRALARHGGDVSSYINQVDDRMDNLMEGIKENEVLTKILTAKITNETNKLQERFQKMTALCREQIEKSQYVEWYLGKLLSSIAL